MNFNRLLKKIPINNNFYKFSYENFSRVFQKMAPIYPGDKVVVLPPWKNATLNRFAKRVVMSKNKEDFKKRYGTVIKVLRYKGLVAVKGVNVIEKYTTPYDEKLFDLMEQGKVESIKRQKWHEPVAVDRVRLVDKDNKIIPAKFVRDESGKRKRINPITNEELPKKKTHKTYQERHKNKVDGPKDTSNELRLIKSYQGESFEMIAKQFIERIQKKEEIEANLILKD